MLRNNNLRIRYIASLLLVMVPILIFSVVLYTSTTERSIQYINDQSLQRFTSATENISKYCRPPAIYGNHCFRCGKRNRHR